MFIKRHSNLFSPCHRTATSQLSEVDTCTYDVVGGQYEVVKKQKQRTPLQSADEKTHSEVHSPTTTATSTGGESKEKFKLSQCPAYGPVTQPKVGGADQPGEYI